MHAFKFESAGFLAHPSWGPPGGGLFRCQASRNVSIFGGSGNYGIMNATMAENIIFSSGCPNLALTSLVRKPQDGETPASAGANWIEAVGPDATSVTISDAVPTVLLFAGGEDAYSSARVVH